MICFYTSVHQLETLKNIQLQVSAGYDFITAKLKTQIKTLVRCYLMDNTCTIIIQTFIYLFIYLFIFIFSISIPHVNSKRLQLYHSLLKKSSINGFYSSYMFTTVGTVKFKVYSIWEMLIIKSKFGESFASLLPPPPPSSQNMVRVSGTVMMFRFYARQVLF